MTAVAPNELSVTPESALPKLGLKPPASRAQVEAAYSAALGEIERMASNSPSKTLTASYRRARQQIEQAYKVLMAARPTPPATIIDSAAGVLAQAPTSPAEVRREPTVEVSINLPQAAQRPPMLRRNLEADPAASGSGLNRFEPGQGPTHEEAQQVIAEARADAAKAREETASAQKVLQELRAQSQALSEDVARVRDRLKSLGDEAEALRQNVAQMGAQTSRELEGISEVRKRADGLLLSAQRNESEIATAAMHAEAYRDSAMYAAQAAERVLRALSAEATNT